MTCSTAEYPPAASLAVIMPVQLLSASLPGSRFFTSCCQVAYGDPSSQPGDVEG